ncbi:Uncharacterised protein [Citrobacter koseri]|uniref:Uncharacterized protein n=1 Tax=Citrobacter koseri TaxID=545 RepID=A0A2X2WH34_CITKO|nr:Uncharacterised protein [Citrobacter koseri]
MAQTLYFEKTFQNALISVDPGTSEFLQLLPTGQLLTGEFRKPRNYVFHKNSSSYCRLAITTGHQPADLLRNQSGR